jgi:FtsP/CotA-like multicopper oxidase with cupredoxin domain
MTTVVPIRLSRGGILLLLGLLALAAGLLPAHARGAEREFNLTIEEVKIQVAPDLSYQVFAFNGQVPGPLIHVQEGDKVTVHVTNNTSLPHTIHWHGLHQQDNWRNDGVPDVTQKAIEPGETFTYHWTADRVGSLWYHCHVNVAEHVGMRGMWGPLIIDPKKPIPIEKEVTRQAIVMLSSWDSQYADKTGQGGSPLDRPNYFSINGRSFPMTQPIRVKKGDVLRIRFVGAGSELHSMHLHGHDMLVTHKDGLPLASPYYADTVLVAPGERYDVIVRMNNPGLWMVHDHIDPHATNNGQHHGGAMTVVEYEGIAPENFYHWKDIAYDSDYFYGDSLQKGYGMFNHDGFKGESASARPRRERHSHE